MGKKDWGKLVVRSRTLSGYQMKRIVSPALTSLYDVSFEKEAEYATPVLTQHDMADMLAVAAPETVMFTLCMRGTLSTRDFREFLSTNGCSHLIADNKAEVEECLSKRRDLGVFLDVMSESQVSFWKYNMECSWSDFLAVKSSAMLRDYEVDYRLVDGTNTWHFIESVGVSNISKYGEELLCLEGKFDPVQVKMMIQRLDEPFAYPPRFSDTFSKRQRLHHIIALSRLIGAEAALDVKMPALVVALRGLTDTANTPEHFAFVEAYLAESPVTDSRGPDYRRILSFYDHGFTVEEALRYTLSDITPERAAESRDHGVVASVAGGWL